MERTVMPSWLFYYVTVQLSLSVAITSSDKPYVGDVRVVLDQAGSQKWTELTGKNQDELRLYMGKTFQEISDVYYKSLSQYDLFIKFAIKDIVVLDFNMDAIYQGDKINCLKLLGAFNTWVQTNNTRDTNHKYDLSLLFTGFDTYLNGYSPKDVTSGISHLDLICFPGGLGLVELSATSNDAFIASHEIGHIMGARHDGLAMTSSCDTEDGHVMSQVPNVTTLNHQSFSPCSAQLIKERIKQLDKNNRNCLVGS